MNTPERSLLYDGSCPIWAWEKHNLLRKDKRDTVAFIDIQAANFSPEQHGASMATWMLQLAVIAFHTIGLSMVAPQLWLDPFGSLVKNIPLLAMLLGLLSLESES